MMYKRTFRIQSAHLNSLSDYETVWRLAEAADDEAWTATPAATQAILDAMRNTHGHNYKIRVWVEGRLRDGKPWLIDDPKLEHVIMGFHNTNLSLLPYFMASKKRATTEELALLMWANLQVVAMEDGAAIARIEVWESDDICASFEPSTDEFVRQGDLEQRISNARTEIERGARGV
jgi:6-pyruvoyl-tetrahydropterin synthase